MKMNVDNIVYGRIVVNLDDFTQFVSRNGLNEDQALEKVVDDELQGLRADMLRNLRQRLANARNVVPS